MAVLKNINEIKRNSIITNGQIRSYKVELSKFIKTIKQVEKDNPLCMEYETDSREVWPDRWEQLRGMIASEIHMENHHKTNQGE